MAGKDSFICPNCKGSYFGTTRDKKRKTTTLNCHGYISTGPGKHSRPCGYSVPYTLEGLGEDNYRRLTRNAGTVMVGVSVGPIKTVEVKKRSPGYTLP